MATSEEVFIRKPDLTKDDVRFALELILSGIHTKFVAYYVFGRDVNSLTCSIRYHTGKNLAEWKREYGLPVKNNNFTKRHVPGKKDDNGKSDI